MSPADFALYAERLSSFRDFDALLHYARLCDSVSCYKDDLKYRADSLLLRVAAAKIFDGGVMPGGWSCDDTKAYAYSLIDMQLRCDLVAVKVWEFFTILSYCLPLIEKLSEEVRCDV